MMPQTTMVVEDVLFSEIRIKAIRLLDELNQINVLEVSTINGLLHGS